MFGKFNSAECLAVLREQIVKQNRLGGCKLQKAARDDEARITIIGLNKNLEEVLGRGGELALSYNKQSMLELRMFFTYAKGDGEYELIREMFDDMDEDDYAFDDVILHNYTEEHGTGLSFCAYNVEEKKLGERADLLISRAFNFLDVFYEALEDEF